MRLSWRNAPATRTPETGFRFTVPHAVTIHTLLHHQSQLVSYPTSVLGLLLQLICTFSLDTLEDSTIIAIDLQQRGKHRPRVGKLLFNKAVIINNQQHRQTIADLLANRRFRLTKPRRAVFEVLVGAGMPLSVAQIHARLNHKSVNLVSVYRTVQLFVELGILRAIDASTGSQRFEAIEPYNDHHHHLICTRCGEIVELEGCLLTDKALDMISHRVRQEKRFEVTGHEVQLLGQCRDCSAALRKTDQAGIRG